MAHSPTWKVYTDTGEYVAAVKYPALAAAVVANLREGSTIRYGHRRIVWTEGVDGQAGESYDVVADVCEAKAARGH